jgi:hypothetical protein
VHGSDHHDIFLVVVQVNIGGYVGFVRGQFH